MFLWTNLTMFDCVTSAAPMSSENQNIRQHFSPDFYHVWLPSFSLLTKASICFDYLHRLPTSMHSACLPLRWMHISDKDVLLLITFRRYLLIKCRSVPQISGRHSILLSVCFQVRDRCAHLTRNTVYRISCGRLYETVGPQILRRGQRLQRLFNGLVSSCPPLSFSRCTVPEELTLVYATEDVAPSESIHLPVKQLTDDRLVRFMLDAVSNRLEWN